MSIKKEKFFLLIFLILLQSCSGGRIGNFFESSFENLDNSNNTLEKHSGNNQIYCSVAHTDKILEKYFLNLKKIIRVIRKCESGESIDNYLETKVSIADFKRLN